jgi:signal transduction histidine kinase
MHDDILQELARVRGRLSHASQSGDDIGGLRDDLDALIVRVREMAFELSPPILEDLGLLPAIEWLAEHMSKRYGIKIEITKDAVNPALESNTRTIAFRAVRELVINAAKHAPGADVLLSCESDASVARIRVRDTGQGFDTVEADVHNPGFSHFGLFTLAQEIRGVGGSFDLVSAVGAGTQATITVPLGHGGTAEHA